MTDFTEEWIRQKQFKLAVENEVQHQPETNLDKQIIDRQLPDLFKAFIQIKKMLILWILVVTKVMQCLSLKS